VTRGPVRRSSSRPPEGTSKGGFTLVELLVVITILLILTGITVGAYSYLMTGVRVKDTEGRVHLLGTRVVETLKSTGSCPASLMDLAPALDAPRLIEAGRFVDAWGQPIEYGVTGKSFKVRSPGPDGVLGTADDIEFAR
jgi:general secretion pathway protein G